MSVENFLDTNVFVYLFDETDENKRETAERLVHGGLRACLKSHLIRFRIK